MTQADMAPSFFLPIVCVSSAELVVSAVAQYPGLHVCFAIFESLMFLEMNGQALKNRWIFKIFSPWGDLRAS